MQRSPAAEPPQRPDQRRRGDCCRSSRRRAPISRSTTLGLGCRPRVDRQPGRVGLLHRLGVAVRPERQDRVGPGRPGHRHRIDRPAAPERPDRDLRRQRLDPRHRRVLERDDDASGRSSRAADQLDDLRFEPGVRPRPALDLDVEDAAAPRPGQHLAEGRDALPGKLAARSARPRRAPSTRPASSRRRCRRRRSSGPARDRG